MDNMGAMIGAMIGMFAVVLLILIAVWLICALAIHKLAVECGHPNAWMAWIPFFSLMDYTFITSLGMISYSGLPSSLLPAAIIISAVCPFLAAIPVVGAIAPFVVFVMTIIILIYKVKAVVAVGKETGNSVALPIVLMILIPGFGMAIAASIMRKQVAAYAETVY